MNSGELTEEERDVLEHIGRYRLAFKEVIETVYFGGRDSQSSLSALVKKGFARAVSGFGGNRKVYVPTSKAVARLNLPRRSAGELGSQALQRYFSIYGFCFLKQKQRHLLGRNELRELFRVNRMPGDKYCLDASGAIPFVHHLYVPGTTRRAGEIAQVLSIEMEKVLSEPSLEKHVALGLYGFAVLVNEADRKRAVEGALDETIDRLGRPIKKVARVMVEDVPNFPQLKQALNEIC